MPVRRATVLAITLLTFGSGLLNLYSVNHPGDLAQLEHLRQVFPIEVIRLSRFATLLMGLALVVCSLNIAKRKRRAWIWTLT